MRYWDRKVIHLWIVQNRIVHTMGGNHIRRKYWNRGYPLITFDNEGGGEARWEGFASFLFWKIGGLTGWGSPITYLVNEVLFSISVTLAPNSWASMAVRKPTGPPPITNIWQVKLTINQKRVLFVIIVLILNKKKSTHFCICCMNVVTVHRISSPFVQQLEQVHPAAWLEVTLKFIIYNSKNAIYKNIKNVVQ